MLMNALRCGGEDLPITPQTRPSGSNRARLHVSAPSSILTLKPFPSLGSSPEFYLLQKTPTGGTIDKYSGSFS